MTPEELDQSRIRIAGPPAGYDPKQGERSNFDWMTYQIKELEKILGKDDTAEWLNRSHSQLHDTSPAKVSLQCEGDEGCKAVAQLIADLITDGPVKLDRAPIPTHVKKIVANTEELPARLAAVQSLMDTFGSVFAKTSSAAMGVDVLVECIGSITNVIPDRAWKDMVEHIHVLHGTLPDSKILQVTTGLVDALAAMRQVLREATKSQPGPDKIIW